MHAWYFNLLFLCHHGEYSYGVLHTVELFTWGLGFHNATMKFSFYFLSAKQMQQSKYAKVKIIHAILKSKYR